PLELAQEAFRDLARERRPAGALLDLAVPAPRGDYEAHGDDAQHDQPDDRARPQVFCTHGPCPPGAARRNNNAGARAPACPRRSVGALDAQTDTTISPLSTDRC